MVSLWQHGIANVVAMQGTGAPEKFVLQRLARSVNNFILCFDGDAGGKSATEKFIQAAGPMAKTGEIQINVVQLPQGKDPDEICREKGVEAFHGLTADAMPWLDWVIDFWAANLDKDGYSPRPLRLRTLFGKRLMASHQMPFVLITLTRSLEQSPRTTRRQKLLSRTGETEVSKLLSAAGSPVPTSR